MIQVPFFLNISFSLWAKSYCWQHGFKSQQSADTLCSHLALLALRSSTLCTTSSYSAPIQPLQFEHCSPPPQSGTENHATISLISRIHHDPGLSTECLAASASPRQPIGSGHWTGEATSISTGLPHSRCASA